MARVSANAPKLSKLAVKRPKGKAVATKQHLEVVRSIATKLNCNSEMQESAENLFLQLFKKNQRLSDSCKHVLTGISVYHTLCKSGNHMQIHDFCNETSLCRSNKFFSVYLKVKTDLTPLSVEPRTEKALVESVFKSDNTGENIQEHSQMVEKTVELFKLAKAALIVTGRSQIASVMACSYFSWKSMKPMRFHVKFNAFFKLYKYNASMKNMAILRENEVQNLLKKLVALQCYGDASDKRVKAKHLGSYLDDLLLQWRKVLKEYQCSSEPLNSETEKVPHRVTEFRKASNKKPKLNDDFDEQKFEDVASDEEVVPDSQWDEYVCPEKEVKFKKKLMEDENVSNEVLRFLTKSDHNAIEGGKSFRRAAYDLVYDNSDEHAKC